MKTESINWRLLALSMSIATCVGMSGHAAAQAPEVLNPPTKSEGKKRAKKTHTKGPNAKFISGSQETNKERDSRLKRECKGQVNAGACLGYTR